MLCPYEYQVIGVSVDGALHLKSACTALDEDTILANPEWVDVAPFASMRIVHADASEPWGASVLRVDGNIVMPTGFPRTERLLQAHGYRVRTLELSELRKAEGGPTCLSILVQRPA
jgi:dimethylargininase